MRLNAAGKYIICQIVLLILSVASYAQVQENNWINPTQKYLKITVTEDGIYEITGEELKNSGWSLSSINSKNLQLFYRGKEVAIKLNTENETSFTSDDSFFFYGQKNDGSRDSLLYRNAPRANPFHSLYTDETAYFLTVGKTTGKRIVHNTESPAGLSEEPYHLAEERIVFTDQFSFNNIIGLVPLLQQSYFENGEGRTGQFIVSDSTALFQFQFKNRVETPDFQPVVDYQINGRSRINHELVASFGEGDSTFLTVPPFGINRKTKALDNRFIQNEAVNLSLKATRKVPLDWYSMTYIQAVYPQQFLMNAESLKYFNLRKNRSKASVISITDLSENALIWNVTDTHNPTEYFPNTEKKFVVPASSNGVKLAVTQSAKTPLKVEEVNFKNFEKPNTDYLIITHSSLIESANEYANYRASEKGGNYTPLIVTSQQLYDTFNYGEKSPIALRKFAEYILSTANPKHVLIIGRGVSFPDELRSNRYPDLVPTIGYPGSDVLITAGLNGFQEDVQAVPTGRLNAVSNAEVISYLNKVKETESRINPELWQKDILHLSGGQNISEVRSLKSILENVSPKAQNGILGGKIEALSKQTDQEIETVDISKQVNAGLGMITFVGHGSANEIDLNIGYCSPPQNGFTNKGKYPVMFFNGCGVGNIFFRYNALSTDWLLTPEKGAIAVFANSFWSYAYPTQRYLDVLYQKLFVDSSTADLTIGEIQQATNLQLTNEVGNAYIKANIHQVILQGDPALRLFPTEKPDFQLTDKSIFITSTNESQPISQNDSINIGVIIQNNGRFVENEELTVSIRQVFQDNTEKSVTANINSVAYQDTVYIRMRKDETVRSLKIKLDDNAQIDEYNEENNEGELQLNDWEEINARTSFPENILPDRLPPVLEVYVNNKLLTNNTYTSQSPVLNLRLTDNEPLDSISNYHFQVLLKDCLTCEYKQLNTAQRVNSATTSTKFELNLPLENLKASTYGLRINSKDFAGNSLVNPYEVQFRVVEDELPSTLLIYPNPSVGFTQIRYTIISVNEPKSVKILLYNLSGKLQLETEQKATIGENSYFLDTKRFSAGKYYAKIIVNDAEVISAPFVVK